MSELPRKTGGSKKSNRLRLPTPPPDPLEVKQDASDFLDYLESLQKPTFGRSGSIFAPVVAAENAFDHLDKLYKLMDQMLVLREQNAKLYRRVRDLEHLNNLQKADKQLDLFAIEDDVLLDQEKDAALAESLFENILSSTGKMKKSRPSILRRQRTTSISTDKLSPSDEQFRPSRRTSEAASIADDQKSSKVSKWTKVKAAFKWEKASPTVGDAKSQDSGLGGMLPVNLEVARYLRVPSTSDELGASPTDSGAAEVSTPGTMSYASSAEDLHRKDHKTPWSSDDEHNDYIPFTSKENSFKETRNKSKTPWAKMKDIIQTRNSFKKKNRLSARSDETNTLDEQIQNSDNEDVFEDETKIAVPNLMETQKVSEDQHVDDLEKCGSKKASRWIKVKKAFITSTADEDFAEILRCKSEGDCRGIQEEIQSNYKQLQEKISLEFQEKINEWEKSKTSPVSQVSNEDPKETAFAKKIAEWNKIKGQQSTRPNLQLQSEKDLPPEFRKKLQEWQKMKKCGFKDDRKIKLGERPKWKSINRSEEVHLDHPPLSEEFLKKLETWKQIKASGGPIAESVKDSKTPSPRMVRKDSPSKKKLKDPHEKELQWFEKELGKIEREKQRLERERQKFLEREERLTKLRRSILGSTKKEVLVHTRSGFHRFEGISRKFTQKLYEWEKAQGIAPEESTFALLSTCYTPEETRTTENQPQKKSTIPRSKSADSIVASDCPLLTSHQPSSLSLNDMEELEKECFAESKASSGNFQDEDEPEAIIVEVEDIIEETAAPLQGFMEMTQTPVYQQETKDLCEGEACVAPQIQRSESMRAQSNYNIIEDSLNIIKLMSEVELEVLKRERELHLLQKEENKSTEEKRNIIKRYYDSQKTNADRLREKVVKLQEANARVIEGIVDEVGCRTGSLVELMEEVQDISAEIPTLVENINEACLLRFEDTAKEVCVVIELLKQVNTKILELRRILSYICAASDATTPERRKPTKIKRHDDKGLYIKAEKTNSPTQGAVKKRIKYRQKTAIANEDSDDDDDDDDISEKRCVKHKRLARMPSTSNSKEEESTDVIVEAESNCPKSLDSPVQVFVKTTRKLFTPIGERAIATTEDAKKEEVKPIASPIPQRKTSKEISPNIRIMLARYNQKISNQNSSNCSTTSNSPLPWRSPASERRIQIQMERYEEEVRKLSPRLDVRKELVKSSSTVALKRQFTIPDETAVCKSSSVGVMVEAKEDDLRSKRIQKAKEEFLKCGSVSVPVKYTERNRLSQVSMDSESSSSTIPGVLMKSASAGMINVDEETYRKIDAEDGFASLPRNVKSKGLLSGKFSFSNIAAKFRKMKMKRGKCGAVSALCRQSLVVDINEEGS